MQKSLAEILKSFNYFLIDRKKKSFLTRFSRGFQEDLRPIMGLMVKVECMWAVESLFFSRTHCYDDKFIEIDLYFLAKTLLWNFRIFWRSI